MKRWQIRATIGSRSRRAKLKSHGQEPEAQGGHAVTVGIRERVPTSACTNDLCKCSICYPCLLSSFSPPTPPASPRRRRFHRGRNGREIQSGSEHERGRKRCEEETRIPREKRGYPKRRRRRGPSIPEPGLDPRPSPPKSSTAARPQFRFVFSAPLLVPPFFLPPRFSLFFIYLPSLFWSFLPDHGDNRPTLHLLLLRLLLLRQCSSGTFWWERTVGKTS